jgi:hypothetical protein
MDLDGLLFINEGKRSNSLDGGGSKFFLKPLLIFVVVHHLFLAGSHPPLDPLLIFPPLKALNDSQQRKEIYFKI